jgi:hypothetical protein
MRLKVYSAIFIATISLLCMTCSSGTTVSEEKTSDLHNPKDSTYSVFLVAGQSNAYFGLGLDTAIDKPSPGIYQLGRVDGDNMKVIEAKEPLQHYFTKPDRVGFALTFAKLYDEYTGKKENILLIPCAMDWTGLTDSSWKRGDCLYNDAVQRANFIMKKYPGSKFVAFLWCQGEKDVGHPHFQTALDTMIAGFRKDVTGASVKTPFVMGGMVPHWIEIEQPRMLHQEILKNTQNRMPNVAYADPYLPFRITKEDDKLDEYHYDAKGQREMGKRFFEGYKKLVEKK